MRLLNAILIIVATLLTSCNSHTCGQTPTRETDSTEIATLLRNLYKWHDPLSNKAAYAVMGNDSLQTGIDTTELGRYVSDLKKTAFFTTSFLNNYKHIGLEADSILKHGKYYNEINFGFQEADPWTGFQDDVPHFWDSLIIHNFVLHHDSASLKWTVSGMSDGYVVKLRREPGGWKIDYLEGFDPVRY